MPLLGSATEKAFRANLDKESAANETNIHGTSWDEIDVENAQPSPELPQQFRPEQHQISAERGLGSVHGTFGFNSGVDLGRGKLGFVIGTFGFTSNTVAFVV